MEPKHILEFMMDTNLDQKFIYHILNELSVSYPEEAIHFCKRQHPDLLPKLKKAMLQARSRQQLSKGVEPVMDLEQLREKWEETEQTSSSLG